MILKWFLSNFMLVSHDFGGFFLYIRIRIIHMDPEGQMIRSRPDPDLDSHHCMLLYSVKPAWTPCRRRCICCWTPPRRPPGTPSGYRRVPPFSLERFVGYSDAIRKVFVYNFVEHNPIEPVGRGLILIFGHQIFGLEHPANMVAALRAHAHAPHVAGEPGALPTPLSNSSTT